MYWWRVGIACAGSLARLHAHISTFRALSSVQGIAELKPLDPFAPQPKMSYKDGYQKTYFVLDSFESGSKLLKDYAASLSVQHGAKMR